jgi:exo-beta-1,3-glucanase (GH17 family)
MKMKKNAHYLILLFLSLLMSCEPSTKRVEEHVEKTAAYLLGNPDYPAISFGGYREKTRDIQPTVAELQEDLRILFAMGVRMLRTYNVQFAEAGNLLKAIRQLKENDPAFEMYVMLGAWIDCKNAWTSLPPDHDQESEQNAGEIDRAVALAKEYPDIVKVIAVGNEAMVKWATSYYVQPGVILKWVNHLQALKAKGELPESLWITSSDNFASWGGGGTEYHVPDLNALIAAVDYISLHTYPMHDTHYNPDFWGVREEEAGLSDLEKIDAAMARALAYAQSQFESVQQYMSALGIEKPVHIGETGWATRSNEHYGKDGSRAVDEYKSAIFYHQMREWTRQAGISCFYFEAFDEQWKDAANPMGSENHFGLINLQAEAKYALWDLVDQGVFEGLTRGGKPIGKTFGGDKAALMQQVVVPPTDAEIQARKIP